ncbi:hypothetical protein BS78_01G352700 [Paspalum vaginatum]|nr:hypothetical protein BS78_01G352700 [Paspalum vaginatum]
MTFRVRLLFALEMPLPVPRMSGRLVVLLAVDAASLGGVMAASVLEISECGYSDDNYAAGSQYERNLGELVATLSGAAAASGGKFHSGTVGTSPPDQAWGLAMCYADCDAARCQDCLRKAGAPGGVAELCPSAAAARSRRMSFVNSDGCLLRYADAPFLGSADTSALLEHSSLSYVADMAGMGAARRQLLSQLAERAGREDQEQRLRLATGIQAYTDASNGSSQTVCGLAQCTGDLEPRECTRCLMEHLAAVTRVRDMDNATGGYVKGISCYLRYQVNEPILEPAPPAPQPSAAPSGAAPPAGSMGGSKAPLTAALAAAAGAVTLLVAGVF